MRGRALKKSTNRYDLENSTWLIWKSTNSRNDEGKWLFLSSDEARQRKDFPIINQVSISQTDAQRHSVSEEVSALKFYEQ